MTRNPTPTTAFASLAALLAFACLDPAAAEDFTFRIPLEVVRFAPGLTNVSVNVDCIVSRALQFDGRLSVTLDDLVARGAVRVTLGPGPVNRSEVVTVAINALSPRLLPASEGRYYACYIADVRLTFPEGDTLVLSGEAGVLGPDYETATGHRLTTVVRLVRGEIPR